MASFRSIILMALFFLIAIPPRAHAQGIIIGNIVEVNVGGRLSCAVPGTLPTPGSTPLGGVKLNITCNGGTTTLGQAVTNTAGFLNATFNIAEGVLLDSSTCVGQIDASSVVGCSLLPPTGVLRVSLVFVRVVQGVAQFFTGLIFIGI